MKKLDEDNGIIPVKFDDVDVYFDIKANTYFAVVKINNHKYPFKLQEDE